MSELQNERVKKPSPEQYVNRPVPEVFQDLLQKNTEGVPSDILQDVQKQITRIRTLFPTANYANLQILKSPLPSGARGWLAIPRAQIVKNKYSYSEALGCVLGKLKKSCFFESNLKGQLGEKHLCRESGTYQTLLSVYRKQEGYDIILIPYGLHTSVDTHSADFYLGIFEVCVLLLTHPELRTLPLLCNGDKYSPNPNFEGYVGVPVFSLYDEALVLDVLLPGDFPHEYIRAVGYIP